MPCAWSSCKQMVLYHLFVWFFFPKACLIPLIAMSLDGVFRGFFAVDFSPFLPFRYLVFALVFLFVGLAPRYKARYDFLPDQISLYTIRWCNWEGEKFRVAVPLTPPSIRISVNFRSLHQFSREIILLFSPCFSHRARSVESCQ